MKGRLPQIMLMEHVKYIPSAARRKVAGGRKELGGYKKKEKKKLLSEKYDSNTPSLSGSFFKVSEVRNKIKRRLRRRVKSSCSQKCVSEGKRLLGKLQPMESSGVSAGALTVCVAELKQSTIE